MNTVNTSSLQELKVKIARRLSSLSPKYSYKLWMDRLDKLSPAQVYVIATQILYPSTYIVERKTSEEKSLEKRIELQFEKEFERRFLEGMEGIEQSQPSDQFAAIAKGKALSDHLNSVRSFVGTPSSAGNGLPKDDRSSDVKHKLLGKRKISLF